MSNQSTLTSLNIVLFGAPGSGKGTQAGRLCKQYDLPHIATGDLFRENLNNNTELGQLARSYMNRGELVPDDVTVAMVRDRLARPDTDRGFLLDGFPRTLPQAKALDQLLTELGRRIDGVLYIMVTDEAIVNRLSGRIICRECQTPFHKVHSPFKTCPLNKCQGEYLYQRDDDNPETVQARLNTFHTQTAPLIDYYKAAGALIEIAGEGNVSQIAERTIAAIEGLKVR
jgi:adenylate kinase